MSTRRRTRILRLALAVPLIAGCGIFGPDEWEDRRAALERSRDRWGNELVDTYRYTLSMSCECIGGFTGPVVIEASEEQITSITPLREDVEVPEEQWTAFLTVYDMFELIESAIDQRAHQFDVQYDAALGHPVTISLDLREQYVDDELLIQVSDLEIVSRVGIFE